MLLKNLSFTSGLVNGTRGVVIGFRPNLTDIYPVIPLVRFATVIGEKRTTIDYLLKEETWDIRVGEA